MVRKIRKCRNVINLKHCICVCGMRCVLCRAWNNQSVLLLFPFSVDERKRNSLVTDAILPPKIQSQCFFFASLTTENESFFFALALLFVVTFAIQKLSAVGLFEWQLIGKLNANVIKCKLFNHISYNVCGKRNKKKNNFLDGKTRPTPYNRLFFLLLLLLACAFSDSEW